ncbi:type VI secretion ATPase ClpV1 family [Clostridium sp. CAG:557]|nr:type VI secretion ATPase ClpV1 family [Clostridium sp. CAG:557]
MKNNKKKVIAAILTVSMMASSVQMTSFAENGSFLDYMINKSETNLKQFQDNKTTLQKIRSWFSSGEEEKATQASINALKKLTFFEKISEMPWSKEQVISASQNAYTRSMAESKTGGIFNRLMSMFFGQSSFVAILFAMQAVGMVRQYYQNFKTKMEAGKIEKPIDPVATMQILDMLMENVKGQEKAKQQIRSMVLNIVDKNAQFMAVNNSKKAGPGASVIYMVGPSGVGKSFSADIIRKVLSGFNAEPFVIEASDIDKQSKSSAVEQLFGMKIKRVSNSEVYEYAPFIQRIKAIPNTVVIINEYDKMHSPELDEKLRTIMDQGYINVNGEKIDCSAATFIITSNESYGSVNKGNNEFDDVDDGTGSRTFINHDKAFLNRIKLIEFDNLSAFDYKQIATVPFAQLAARYKVQYGINLDLNGTIDAVAQRVEELNKGARPIFTYLESLNDKLLNEVVLQKLNSGSRNIKYRVSFENDKFNLERLDGNKILCEEDSSGQEAADNKLTVAKNNEEILSGEGNPSETNMMADKSTAEEDNAAKKNSKAE